MTYGQETEQLYSYNPTVRTGLTLIDRVKTGFRDIVILINLYTEPGIEATACARELLYVYVLSSGVGDKVSDRV